jgi:hypothetical protein
MPIDFAAFTADRRISSRIFLADDRLSDMLNSVGRIVLRDALVEDLVDGCPPVNGDLAVPIGDLVVVVGTAPRGGDTPRRRTVQRTVSVGLGRFVVSGELHLPADNPRMPDGDDPAVVFAGRDLLVPLTAATITYDRNNVPQTDEHDAILFNRARATWVEVQRDAAVVAEAGEIDEAMPIGRTDRRPTYLKDFTNTVAD